MGVTTENRFDLRSVVTTSGMLAIGQLAIMVVSAIVQMILLATLSKEDNGQLFLIRRAVELVLVLTVDFGLNPIGMREIVQRPHDARSILGSLLIYRLVVWGILIPPLLAGTALFALDPMLVAMWCLYMLLAGRSSLLRYVYELERRASMKVTLPVAMTLLDVVLYALGLYLYRDHITVESVLTISVVSSLPGFFIVWATAGTSRPSIRDWTGTEVRTLLRAAIPVQATMVFMAVHDKVDAFLIRAVTTEEQVGIFGAAYQTLAPLTLVVPYAVSMALAPRIARDIAKEPQLTMSIVAVAMRFLLAAGVLVSTIVSILLPWILQVFTRGRYSDNYIEFFSLLWSVTPIYVTSFLGEVFIAMNSQRLNLLMVAILACGSLITGLILIPGYEALGASASKTITVTIAAVSGMLFLVRSGKSRAFATMPFTMIAVMVVSGAASYLLPLHFGMAASLTLAIPCSLASIVAFGLVRRSDLRNLRTILRPTS